VIQGVVIASAPNYAKVWERAFWLEDPRMKVQDGANGKDP